MTDRDIYRIGCAAIVRAWRREASALRKLAHNPALKARQRYILRREAEAADRQADMWSDETDKMTIN